MASFIASLGSARLDCGDFRAEQLHRKTFSDCRSTSTEPMKTCIRAEIAPHRCRRDRHAARAGLGADADLFIRTASSAWPSVLFTLCAPV